MTWEHWDREETKTWQEQGYRQRHGMTNGWDDR